MPKKEQLILESTKSKIIELYQKGEKITKIATIFNIHPTSVSYILKTKIGYSNKRPSQGNITYFKKIDTHSKAYILGFIAADGNISKTIKLGYPLYRMTIRINPKDYSIIDFIKSEIKFNTKIQNTKYFDSRTNKTNSTISISLGNQELCKDLMNLGILERKTLLLQNFLLNIPKKFRKAAILGYFDGDGHVGDYRLIKSKNLNYIPYKIVICGTKNLLQGIKNELRLTSPIKEKINHHILEIGNKSDYNKFYTCYNQLLFFLKRKHDVFLKRFNYKRTISFS